MVVPVAPWPNPPDASVAGQAGITRPTPRKMWFKSRLLWAVTAILALLFVAAVVFNGRSSVTRSQSSTMVAPVEVVVLPFLDLTDGIRNEAFTDGMTAELIGRLSKVPGLKVPAAAASLSFRSKKLPPAEIAKDLGAEYVLVGSTRKSGPRLRVAAQLLRAADGHVLWSETYDRPAGDLRMVQDDITGDVTRALTQPIDVQP